MIRTYALFCLMVLFVVLVLPIQAFCTEDYAGETGRACRTCHLSPAGGGTLTASGESFRDELRAKGRDRPLNPIQHIVRFIIGYLHMLTAVIWFGTILYVHLLLKPAYAARGLPKGELWLGWVSIAIMAVTGTLLTIARVPSWYVFFHTRFGILLLIKISLFIVMVAAATLVTFVIGPKLKKRKESKTRQQKRDLTPEEVSEFDGKEGRPAYIVFRKTVYDVTQSKFWKKGSHMERHQAGADLTDLLKQAPHGEDNILPMPVVGKLLASSEKRGKPPEIRVFYFFAYMNLVIVFMIIFIIALWRWW